MPRFRVLSVGQCLFDHHAIARMLSLTFDAAVEAAPTAAAAEERLRAEPFDLVLVNRIGDRDGQPGVNFIRSMKANPALAHLPVLLVTNYPDAQAEAIALGALPGFGKASLHDPATVDCLARALGIADGPRPSGRDGS